MNKDLTTSFSLNLWLKLIGQSGYYGANDYYFEQFIGIGANAIYNPICVVIKTELEEELK